MKGQSGFLKEDSPMTLVLLSRQSKPSPGCAYYCCTHYNEQNSNPVMQMQLPLEQRDSQNTREDHHCPPQHLVHTCISAILHLSAKQQTKAAVALRQNQIKTSKLAYYCRFKT